MWIIFIISNSFWFQGCFISGDIMYFFTNKLAKVLKYSKTLKTYLHFKTECASILNYVKDKFAEINKTFFFKNPLFNYFFWQNKKTNAYTLTGGGDPWPVVNPLTGAASLCFIQCRNKGAKCILESRPAPIHFHCWALSL